MKHILFCFTMGLVVALSAVPAFATDANDVNGVKINERVFNDFTTTTLVTTNNYPASVEFNETNYTDDGIGGSWANRHDAILSIDSGLSEAVFSIDDPISFSADVTLTPGSNTPRKEAGLRLNSSVTGDALFIINSDVGEIVAFGGGAPFYSFGSGATGYTSGDTIRMGMDYIPSGGGPNGVPGLLRYWIDRGADGLDIETSGFLAWANLEGGPVDFQAGFYLQVAPDLSIADSSYASFKNISVSVIPEPASIMLAVLAVIAGAMLAKR
ncbi:MAG: hypothetical protein JW829_16955 [Pirellulales bacterium]|nr:hypothetical protein [Pirellulales bacterium]